MDIEKRIVLQPHLGEYSPVYKPEDNMNSITLGKILEYNPKYHTATVMLLKSKNIIGTLGDPSNKFGVRIGVSSASCNEETMAVSGVIDPVQVGQIVVVGFIDGLKGQPIILTSLHNVWHDSKNMLQGESNPSIVDRNKYLRVFPSQAYVKVDGLGGVEMGHPSKSFFVATHDDIDLESFNYDDLTEKHPVTGKSYEPDLLESAIPLSVVFCHRNYTEPTKSTRVTVNKEGELQVARILEDSSSSISVSNTGEVQISRTVKNSKSSITISDAGEVELRHSTGSYIKLSEDGDVIISAQHEILFIENGKLKEGEEDDSTSSISYSK